MSCERSSGQDGKSKTPVRTGTAPEAPTATRLMGRLIKIQDIDQFCEIINIPEAAITADLLESVRQLDERRDLEPMLREILWDPTETPHGPTEIADILTTKVRVRGERRLAAFVVKGKSFAKVRSQHIDYQIIRLRQLPALGVMALVAVGHVQDSAQRDFLQMAKDAGCDYLIVEALDCARLLLAYEKICTSDGTPYGPDGSCRRGHNQDKGIQLKIRARDGVHYEIPQLRDVSHGGARRLTATVLVDPHYDREVLREIIREATRQVRLSSYHRSKLVRSRWRDSSAHVVWLYLAANLQDLSNANWLARTQWIDPGLDRKMRPLELSASEHLDTIAITWNDSYTSMQEFYREHSVDKGGALAQLEPLVAQATLIGSRIASWFDAFESSNLDETTLIARVRTASPEIDAITNQALNLPFPPQDVRDYDTRAQSLFGHLGNMALYYSERGVTLWSEENRTFLMHSTVKDIRADIGRLKFEREKLH